MWNSNRCWWDRCKTWWIQLEGVRLRGTYLSSTSGLLCLSTSWQGKFTIMVSEQATFFFFVLERQSILGYWTVSEYRRISSSSHWWDLQKMLKKNRSCFEPDMYSHLQALNWISNTRVEKQKTKCKKSGGTDALDWLYTKPVGNIEQTNNVCCGILQQLKIGSEITHKEALTNEN